MKNLIKFVAIVYGLAGVVACVDIILAEFFDRGTPPDISFMIVLLFWVIFPHMAKDDLFPYSKHKLVQMPLIFSIILYVLSYFSII